MIDIDAILCVGRESTSDKLYFYCIQKTHTVHVMTTPSNPTSDIPATDASAGAKADDAFEITEAIDAAAPEAKPPALDVSTEEVVAASAPPVTQAESIESSAPEPAREKTQPVYADPSAELSILEPLIQALTAKQTTEINSLGNRLGEIRKQLADEPSLAKEKGQALHTAMVELLAQNKAHQEDMSTKANASIEELKLALDGGHSDASLSAWDKIQTALMPLSGKLRNTVQKQLNEHRTRYQELKDWKLFASAEKKKELIAAMELLLESDIQGAERAKAISAAHQEWKTLGRSQQNESLWKKFKKLSDDAYAPCKDHFKQRKQSIVANFDNRVALCAQLEADLERLSSTDTATAENGDSSENTKVNEQRLVAEIGTIISAAEQRWKDTAPVEQAKIKELQKRYYGLLNNLRKLRREASQENANRKLEAIAQAEALAASDDRAEAMHTAKELQRQWKEIGPSNHKDDQNYWRAFRAACDSIFTRETGESAESRPRRENAASRNSKTAHASIDIAKVSAELDALLSSLESLLALDDEEFRQAREQYQDKSQQFSAASSPKLGNRGKIYTERFTTLKRRFDTRYKALPDKRQQQRIETVTALTDKLDAFEASLLSAKDGDEFATAKAAFDPEAWKALTRPDDNSFTAILEARLASLLKLTKAAELDKLSSEAASSARRLCTELEISANVDTPSADQALRMQLQLEQLKAVFGQAKRSAADVIKHSRVEQLRLQCLGPLSPEKRKELRERFDVAAAKLSRG